MKKRVLFHRNFQKFQGGHLSFWNYTQFVRQSDRFEAQIYFSKDTLWDASNPWVTEKNRALSEWDPSKADILVLGIVDWPILSEVERDHPPCPIVHPVLNSRIADPADPAHLTLRHRAVRICPSKETAEAIQNTGIINGPVFVIPHGIDTSTYPIAKPFEKRSIDLLIVGLKNPALAGKLFETLKNSLGGGFSFFKYSIEVLTDLIPRDRFLDKISDAKITLFLPNPREGFYRPILEGMALETLCLAPKFIGKSDLYKENINLLSSDYEINALKALCRRAASISQAEREKIIASGKAAVFESSIDVQRQQFLSILEEASSLF